MTGVKKEGSKSKLGVGKNPAQGSLAGFNPSQSQVTGKSYSYSQS